jgi:3-hydroxyisobutyrate dehydrogenase-like beta-hydroxyacid dehydrogenase
MAFNLLKAGYPLTLYVHRKRDGIDRLLAMGANEVNGLGELAHASDALVLCLSDAQVVCQVVGNLEPGLRAGQVIIDATTSDPRVSRDLAARLRLRGVVYADAPVTGSPRQAEAGALGSMVGCDEEEFARIERIISAYSTVVRRMGGVGAGHIAKLLNNFVTQGTVALLADAYGRAREFGVEWRDLYAVMEAGAARSGTLEKMLKPALDGNFDGSNFSMRNAMKDLGYFCHLAADSKAGASELAKHIQAVFAGAVAAGFGERNVSVLLDPVVQADISRRAFNKFGRG